MAAFIRQSRATSASISAFDALAEEPSRRAANPSRPSGSDGPREARQPCRAGSSRPVTILTAAPASEAAVRRSMLMCLIDCADGAPPLSAR